MNYNKYLKKIEMKNILHYVASNDHIFEMSKINKKKPRIINNCYPIFPELRHKISNIKSKYGYINYTIKQQNPIEQIINLKKKFSNNPNYKPYILRVDSTSKLYSHTNNNTELSASGGNNDLRRWNSNLKLSKQNDFLYLTTSKKNSTEYNEKGDSKKNMIIENIGKHTLLKSADGEENFTTKKFRSEEEIKIQEKMVNTIIINDEQKKIEKELRKKKDEIIAKKRQNFRKSYVYHPSNNSKEKFNRIKSQTNQLLSNIQAHPLSLKDLQNRIKSLKNAKKYLYKEGIGKDSQSIDSSKSSDSSDTNLGFKGIRPKIQKDNFYEDLLKDKENNYKLNRLTKPTLIRPSSKPKLNVLSYSNLKDLIV